MRRVYFPQIAFFNSARARLILLVLLVFIPALAMQVYEAWRDLQRDIGDQKLASVQVIERAQGDFDSLIATTRTVFADLVRVNEMRSTNNCTQIFTALRFAYERLASYATNIGLADAQGNIYCAINPIQGNRNIAGQTDFQSAIKTLDLSLGVYTPGIGGGAPAMSASYPILSFSGDIQTVLFLTIDTRWLETWQGKMALPPDATVTLFSPGGEVLWRAVNEENVPAEGLTSQQVSWYSSLVNGDSTTIEGQDFDGVVRLHTMLPLGQNNQRSALLHLGYPVVQLYDEEYAFLRLQLGLMAILAIFVLLLAGWGSEVMFLRPLSDLMGAVKRVQGGDLDVGISRLKGLGELTELAGAFDQMTDALRRREAERRQLEERFTAAFRSSALGIEMLGLDGQILTVNEALCRMLGYTEEELKTRNDHQNVFPPDLEIGQDLRAEMMAGERGYFSVEKRYERKNGKPFWTRLTLSLVRGEDGEPSYLVGLIEDIDAEKQKSAALAESEARFRTMFNTAAVGIGIMGLDRRVIDVNPALCQMYGYTHDELIGQTNALVVHPEDYPRTVSQYQGLMDGKYDHFLDERRYIRKNGEIFWAAIAMSLVRDEQGAPLYLVGMVTDINERKKAQDTLRESEARFKAMYNNTAVGMAMMTLDRKIISMNQASARMTGYTIEELVNSDPARLSHPEDVEIGMDQFRAMVAGDIPGFQMEKRFIRKDGNIFWGRVSYSIVPTFEGKPEYLVGIIEDVTEERESAAKIARQADEYRSQLEKRVAERTLELNQANERLREKAAQDAVTTERTRLARELHDAVTQTLFSITLIADVLPDLWNINYAEGRRRLEELRVLTRGALAEMRTLLVELRPNALVEVPLPTLLRQLVDALVGRARINIQLSAEGERKLPADVQVGLYRLAQEALNNIIKHAKASEAAVTLRMGEMVRMTIADNGKGFDPSTVTADHLGLKIMRERAESIGANLSIYSEPGEGTQITIVWHEKMETE